MSAADAVTWLQGQLPEMEKALEALVNQNSYTSHRAGGQQVVAALEKVFALPHLTAERVSSERFADHLVFTSAGHGGRPVALLGHLDTVFPPGHFEGYRVDGALRRGPGVLDMKGGLVVIAWALKAIARTVGLDHISPLRIVLVSDEEVGSPEGAPLIARVAKDCVAALVFESGRSNDAIVTRRKGTSACRCLASGKAAHAGNNYFDGANAIWSVARFIDAAQQLSQRQTGVTVNAGLVVGGTAKNTVAASAEAQFDLRFVDAHSMQQLTQQLNALAVTCAVPGTSMTLEFGPTRPPLEKTAASEALMQSYARCAVAQGLAAPEAELQGGGSDANTTSALGIPSIDGLGPRGRFFHTPDEYIEVHTLIQRAAALAQWLMENR